MFESLSHLALQQYWWCIIALLGALLVFLMFVQGGQTLIHTLGKNDLEQKMIINALGRKWEFTFTTLVTFGGAFFASFPLFYATSFGGAYWVWIVILFAFIVQAVSYQYRSKPNNLYGKGFYEAMLVINGVLGTILIGTAVATFFTGSEFSLDEVTRQVQWQGPAYGLEAVLNPLNPILGIAVFFLARVLAILFFMNTIDNENIFRRAKKRLVPEAGLFLVFFLTFLIWVLLKDGFAVNPETKEVYMEPYKYFNNLLAMPVNTIILLVGVVLVLWGIISSIIKDSRKGIWFAGSGTVLTVFALFILAGFNNTAFYPSTYDLQASLTIENSSSSHFTLTAMSYVSLMVPFVVAYIWYAWKALTSKRITEEEMTDGSSHAY
ncbi:cytochrome bd-I ubiquinol oxidase subunit 2 apoprotein [Balneicella halophila]|uniref:Cytochrome bd-I ubiquinol oxidase subunit 2 apoprotein n=1 Tax=Balneicella halophila TaxID=1537566 RepID=A0A7L4UQ76_BALHA|nr:cytochrome d ubiquinol oxidase subunit II [Balneicella halophila]PVX51903.1 cytochrome bd-I ubiquinol oxidase subunit 2 apoprotein [Balneicella halophila]